MAVTNVPQTTCPANVKTTSASTPGQNTVTDVLVALVSTEWDAKAGTGTLTWGVEYFDAATWRILVAQSNLLIGSRDRSGGMPQLHLAGDVVKQVVGVQLRLFAQPTVAIALGATITAT